MTRKSLKDNNKPWWVGCLALASPGCICVHSPLFPPPLAPVVLESHACPQARAMLAPRPMVLASPQSQSQSQSPPAVVRSVPLTVTPPPPPPDVEELPPELPGSITVPSLTPGEPLPSAAPGPRPTLSVPNRPGRRRLLVLDGAGGGAG